MDSGIEVIRAVVRLALAGLDAADTPVYGSD